MLAFMMGPKERAGAEVSLWMPINLKKNFFAFLYGVWTHLQIDKEMFRMMKEYLPPTDMVKLRIKTVRKKTSVAV